MTTIPVAVPRLGGGLPLLGHAFEFYRDPVKLIQRGRDLHGDVFTLRLFGRLIHVLTGAAGNAAFFKAPDAVLSVNAAYRFTVPIFGKGLVYDVGPELMDQQLRLVYPALREDKMQSYVRFIAAEVENYLDGWGQSGTKDLMTSMEEITTRTAGRCLIGAEFEGGFANNFARLLRDLEGGINLVAFFLPNFPLPAMLRRDRARRQVVEMVSGLIKARRMSGAITDDFLGTLIAARGSDGEPLSDDSITGLLLALWFAGQHTSAVLATWTGVLLLQKAQHLDRILAEQGVVLGNQGVTPSAIRQLSYLENCIKEAERLRPPLIMLMRTVLMPFECHGYILAPGDLVMVSPAVSHRIPELFAEPDRFDPDRFAPPREEDRRMAFSLIGFGGGKHRCTGLAFAIQQIKVIWSVLLRRYALDLIHPDPDPNYATFVVGPRPPCVIKYQARLSSDEKRQ